MEAVEWGLNWLFNGYVYNTSYPMLRTMSVSRVYESIPADTNGNGKGIETRDYGYRPVYQGGMVIDAIIASGTPDADCGRDFDGDGSFQARHRVGLNVLVGDQVQNAQDLKGAGIDRYHVPSQCRLYDVGHRERRGTVEFL